MSGSPVPFSIGLFSDVQYAKKENRGASHYRESLKFLDEAIACFNEHDLRAVINLGDLVDSNGGDHLDATLSIMEKSIHPLFHIIGNHDLIGPLQRKNVLSRLMIKRPWGECLKKDNWRFVVVDSTEVSFQADGSRLDLSNEEIIRLKQLGDPCAEVWNGMASKQQMKDLEELLIDATRCGNRVVILNHMVTGSGSGSLAHRCWNHEQLTGLINKSPCVAAHFNGHDHSGGFATDRASGVHYLTLPAICDSGGKTGAHGIARFDKNSITLEGWGRVKSRTLECERVKAG